MSVTAALEPELLKAVATTCTKCWRAANPAPPASAIYLMDDYKWQMTYQCRLEEDVMRLAWDGGYEGTRNDLQLAAHREAYARSGDDADLAKMLRHVVSDA